MNKKQLLAFSIITIVYITINVIQLSDVYGQSFECDNNFGDCGTPEQSGGGGGGGGSVLIANTDLGDTYQHADYCDDDIDNDQILNSDDECPYHYGNSYCFESLSVDQPRKRYSYSGDVYNERKRAPRIDVIKQQGCNSSGNSYTRWSISMIVFAVLFWVSRKRRL
jgi:hypothetical protein